MESANGSRFYQRLIATTLLLSAVVVGLGAFTRLTEAGLGCPDWPGCYGFVSVPDTPAQIEQANQAFPHAPVEAEKARNEMLHRYVAGTLGLLIVWIAWLSWRSPSRPKWLTLALVCTVFFQAALGMWTVTLNLMPIVVMGHLLGGFITVSLLFLLAIKTGALARAGLTPFRKVAAARLTNTRLLTRLGFICLFAVALQIALGGWTSANYAATVCTTLPVCEVDWLSTYDHFAFHPVSPVNDTYQFGVLNFDQRVTIHATHRLGAMLVSALIVALIWQLNRVGERRIAVVLTLVLSLQIMLGVTNVVAMLPLPIAVAHNLGGLALLQVMIFAQQRISFLSRRMSRPVSSVNQGANHGEISSGA